MLDNLGLIPVVAMEVDEPMSTVGDYHYEQFAGRALFSPVGSHQCLRRELMPHLSYWVPTGFIDIS